MPKSADITPGKSCAAFSSQLVFIKFKLFLHLLPIGELLFGFNITNSLRVNERERGNKGPVVRGNQMCLPVAWIENRCFSRAVLQMSKTLQMLQVLFDLWCQRHQRGKAGQKQSRKREKTEERAECVC